MSIKLQCQKVILALANPPKVWKGTRKSHVTQNQNNNLPEGGYHLITSVAHEINLVKELVESLIEDVLDLGVLQEQALGEIGAGI